MTYALTTWQPKPVAPEGLTSRVRRDRYGLLRIEPGKEVAVRGVTSNVVSPYITLFNRRHGKQWSCSQMWDGDVPCVVIRRFSPPTSPPPALGGTGQTVVDTGGGTIESDKIEARR